MVRWTRPRVYHGTGGEKGTVRTKATLFGRNMKLHLMPAHGFWMIGDNTVKGLTRLSSSCKSQSQKVCIDTVKGLTRLSSSCRSQSQKVCIDTSTRGSTPLMHPWRISPASIQVILKNENKMKNPEALINVDEVYMSYRMLRIRHIHYLPLSLLMHFKNWHRWKILQVEETQDMDTSLKNQEDPAYKKTWSGAPKT
jgi:hypothetical protein